MSDAVKEQGVSFPGPQILGILAGHKTMMRRVIEVDDPYIFSLARVMKAADGTFVFCAPEDSGRQLHGVKCPYGMPGDRLWVREAWQQVDKTWPYVAGRPSRQSETDQSACIVYAADGDPPGGAVWASAEVMHRRVSRIELEIESVRAQRLNDIAEIDAENELGIKPYSTGNYAVGLFANYWGEAHSEGRHMWGANPCNTSVGWGANPWVWVISFRLDRRHDQ